MMSFRNMILAVSCTSAIAIQSASSTNKRLSKTLSRRGSMKNVRKSVTSNADVLKAMSKDGVLTKKSSKENVKKEPSPKAPSPTAVPALENWKQGDRVRFKGNPSSKAFRNLPGVYGTIVSEHEKSVGNTKEDDEFYRKWIVRVNVDQEKKIPDVLMKPTKSDPNPIYTWFCKNLLKQKKHEHKDQQKTTILVCANDYRFERISDKIFHEHVFGETQVFSAENCNPLFSGNMGSVKSVSSLEDSSSEPQIQQSTM